MILECSDLFIALNKEFLKVFLSDVLENYIIKQRWFGGKASKIKYIELAEYFRIQQNNEVYFGLIFELIYLSTEFAIPQNWFLHTRLKFGTYALFKFKPFFICDPSINSLML